MSQEITVCYASNDNYVGFLGISVMSLCQNAEPEQKISIYVIDNKISEKGKKELISLQQSYNFSLTFLPFDESLFDACLPPCKMNGIIWQERSIFGRYLIPQLIPADKVLYLDCDVLIRHSLSELWKIDLDHNYIAGVPDFHIMKMSYLKQCFGQDYDVHEYVNSGVLVMNSRLWREDRLLEKLMAYNQENATKLKCPDQDAINYVCRGRIKHLPERYNVRNYVYMPDLFADSPRMEEIINEGKDPIIRHFHPWQKNYFIIHREEWINLAKKSPWQHLIPRDDPFLIAWAKNFLDYWLKHPLFFLQPRFYRRLKARGAKLLFLGI